MYLLNSKKITPLVLATLFVAIASFSASAQKKKTAAHSEPKKPVIISEAGSGSSSESGKSTASSKSSNIFVQSLRDQLAVREREVTVAKETLEKTKQLFTDGIVSKRAVEEAEVAFVEAQTKADDVRRKISAYEGTPIEANNTANNQTTAENKIEEEAKKDDVVVTTTDTAEKKSTVKRTSQTKAKKPVKKGKGKN